MDNDFKHKLKNLDFVLRDIIDELEGCPISRLDIQAEQALELIYNFTDMLAELEESRYNSTTTESAAHYAHGRQSAYEDFDYVDEEVDVFHEEDTEKYAQDDND